MDIVRENREKLGKIRKLAEMIKIHSVRKIPPEQLVKIEEEQDRLQYKLLELESKGFDLKIESMEKVLSILKMKQADIELARHKELLETLKANK